MTMNRDLNTITDKDLFAIEREHGHRVATIVQRKRDDHRAKLQRVVTAATARWYHRLAGYAVTWFVLFSCWALCVATAAVTMAAVWTLFVRLIDA